jgi:putative transposase
LVDALLPVEADLSNQRLLRNCRTFLGTNTSGGQISVMWRSVKYEEVYLKAYDSVAQARASIACYLAFYNERRPHSALDRRTPDEAYFGSRAIALAA